MLRMKQVILVAFPIMAHVICVILVFMCSKTTEEIVVDKYSHEM